jgi:hypothetical protein
LVCCGQCISSMKFFLNLRFVTHHAILITSRKLHHYFDEYKILVVTDFPLADILYNRDANGHISKWAVELGALSMTSNLASPSSRKH